MEEEEEEEELRVTFTFSEGDDQAVSQGTQLDSTVKTYYDQQL